MIKQKLQRLKNTLWLWAAAHSPVTGGLRYKMARRGGVTCLAKTGSIGEGTILDHMYPENIVIHDHVIIAMKCIILTHYLDPNRFGAQMEPGKVELDDFCFIGAGTIICNPVRIGKNSIVGAGSVVTKDIPDNEIWAGCPAKFIKKRTIQ